MADLQQLNIGFDPVQDRLLMRIRSGDAEEVRLWLTRRYVRLLWGVIADLLAERIDPEVAQRPEARKALLDFRHQQALSETDFDTPYDDGAQSHPLGDEPILVTEIRKRVDENGRVTLGLAPAVGGGVELGGDDAMLHAIARFLADAARSAQWDLDLDSRFGSTVDGPVAQISATRH